MNYKILYFDLETTGTRYWKDGIHQISGCVDINGKVEEWIDLKVQPNPKSEISDEALAVSGTTREDMLTYMSFNEGYKTLIAFLSKYVDKFDKKDKMFLCGYNISSFDTPFLRAFFVQNGDNYFGSWFYSASLDVMVIAAQYLVTERVDMKDFKLGTVAEYMGIQTDPLKQHNARYDIEITRELHRRVIVPFVKQKVAKRDAKTLDEKPMIIPSNPKGKPDLEKYHFEPPPLSGPGMMVKTRTGEIGRTYNSKGFINKKVPVYLASEFTKDDAATLIGMSIPTRYHITAILCDPTTLETIGFID